MADTENPQDPRGPRTSFAQRLAANRQAQTSANTKSVGDIITEVHEGLLFSGDFLNAVEQVNRLGVTITRTTGGYPLNRAVQVWYQMPWAERRKFLDAYAGIEGEGGDVARQHLQTIQLFEESPLLAQMLREVIDEMDRATRGIHTKNDFDLFLFWLADKSLAAHYPNPPGGKRSFEWQGKWYIPTNVTKARLAWPYVVRTLGRMRRQTEVDEKVLPRLAQLIEVATLDSNPENQYLNRLLVHADEEGSLVIYDPATRVGEERTGLLAVLIGRRQAGDAALALMGVVSDKPLPAYMQGDQEYELPQLMIFERPDGALEVNLPKTNLPKEEHSAVLRILFLIRYWLRQEGIFRTPALPAKST